MILTAVQGLSHTVTLCPHCCVCCAGGQGDSAVFVTITQSLSDISLAAVQGCRCAGKTGHKKRMFCFYSFVFFYLDSSLGLLQIKQAHAWTVTCPGKYIAVTEPAPRDTLTKMKSL